MNGDRHMEWDPAPLRKSIEFTLEEMLLNVRSFEAIQRSVKSGGIERI